MFKTLQEWFIGPQCEEHCWHYDERNNNMFERRQCCKCPRHENRVRSPQSKKGHGDYYKPQRSTQDPWGPWRQPIYQGP